MALSHEEKKLLTRREKRLNSWPYVGSALFGLLGACSIWLWIKVPYLISPWAVWAAIQDANLSESTALLMVAMLPVVVLTLVLFAVAVVALIFVAFANERKLIRIIRRLSEH